MVSSGALFLCGVWGSKGFPAFGLQGVWLPGFGAEFTVLPFSM